MKNYTIKTKHVLTVFAVALTSMFTLSSCDVLFDSVATLIFKLTDKRTDAEKAFDYWGYHFTAEAPTGQVLCFRYLDSLNVSCVTPKALWDPATDEHTTYKITGEVVIPMKVSDGVKTFDVSKLGDTKVIKSDIDPRGRIEVVPWTAKDITNLVIPPSIKKIDGITVGDSLKNIIVYGLYHDNYYGALEESKIRAFGSDKNKDCWVHVPRGSRVFEYTKRDSTFRIVEIAYDYDIYEKDHSLGEYLELARHEIDMAKLLKKIDWDFYNDDWRADFAVNDPENENDVVMYFRILDKDQKEVRLCEATDGEGNRDWYSFYVPTQVYYRGELYTVTEAGIKADVVAVPETCRRYKGSLDELICYSSDCELSYNGPKVLHVPHGCVEKYMEKANYRGSKIDACLEMVNNYDVFEDEHSIEEYLSISRDAVEKAKAEKKQAEEKARVAAQKKKEAEDKAARDKMNKRWGKKYVDAALLRREIVVGMPEELFIIGVQENVFEGITNATLDYESAGSKRYKLYGYKIYNGSSVHISSSSFIGRVWVKNGRISSIKWL